MLPHVFDCDGLFLNPAVTLPFHQVSSGAGIVHSGGESLRTVTLTEFLEDLRAKEDGGGVSSTSFTFDLEFIDRNQGEPSKEGSQGGRDGGLDSCRWRWWCVCAVGVELWWR